MKKRYIAPIIRKVDIESDPLMEVVSMPVIDNGGDKEKTAEALKVNLSTLYRKLSEQ